MVATPLNQLKGLPLDSYSLIESLKASFPLKSFNSKDTYEEILAYCAVLDVIAQLERIRDNKPEIEKI